MPTIARNDSGEQVAKLHEQLVAFGHRIPAYEREKKLFGVGTDAAVRATQQALRLPMTGMYDDATSAALARFLAEREIPSSRLEGRLLYDNGAPAAGVPLRIYQRGIGAAAGEPGVVKTDADGYYHYAYATPPGNVNLEVYAVDAAGAEIALGYPKLGATKYEVMNLVAPRTVKAQGAEHARLLTDLKPHLAKLGGKLGNATEGKKRQDLTLLHRDTGWDARLVGLAARADALEKQVPIGTEALYGLFRAGMPTDTEQLATVSSLAVEKALSHAAGAGIVALDAAQIGEAKKKFDQFAAKTRASLKVEGTPSSFGELLESAGGISDAGRERFLAAYFTPRKDAGTLWKTAKELGVADAELRALRVTGKLAYLTVNNASLVAKLQEDVGPAGDLTQLVEKGLYKAEAWEARLKQAAGGNAGQLGKLIPDGYGADKDAALRAYSDDLARMVRLSYPTRVLAHRLESGDLKIGNGGEAALAKLLRKAEAKGFKVGQASVTKFLAAQPQLFDGVPEAERKAATSSLKRVQRLHQITPSDHAMQVLLDNGFDSAYDVVRYTLPQFLARYGPKFRNEVEAKLVYRKSEVVTTTLYTLFTTAQQARVTPPVFTLTLPPAERQAATEQVIKTFPTMESLFGSMDYCECEHCRTVLSPAAYLVDLLQFLERDRQTWKNFTDDWQARHNVHYPFLNAAARDAWLNAWRAAHPGQPDPDTRKTPYDVLIERRPDLPTLPLTCENTNTALPYIDVVNEILEHYVAHDSIANATAHDTGDAATEDLLAEPQNIEPAAYDKLASATFPPSLPFDYWTESVRSFFAHFEIPLWRVMEVFRTTDKLFADPADPPAPYNRDAVFAEAIGLSPVELAIFRRASPAGWWFELYGFTGANAEATALAALESAKTMSQRLGLTYQELVDVVRTGFVNPKLQSLALLRKFDVDLEEVLRYKAPNGSGYPAFTAPERQAFEERLAAKSVEYGKGAEFGIDTLNAAWNAGDFTEMLVLSDPNATCDFDRTTLRRAVADATAIDLHRLSVFVRLWKKLGWTIDETDRALLTFLPRDLPLTNANFPAAMGTALHYLGAFQMVAARLELGADERQKLLTFWSALPTTGRNPLYAQLFLTPGALENAAVFDDPLGRYLSANPPLREHVPAVQAALSLSREDIERILADNGATIDGTNLSMDVVSLLYRYALLAKTLRLSVRDFIVLKQLSGLDPFRALEPGRLLSMAEHHPFEQTLRFLEMVDAVKATSLTPEALDYLLRHRRDDPVGLYREEQERIIAYLCSLAATVRRIREENAVPADASTLADDVLRQKLALDLPGDVLETFWKMWTWTVEYRAVVAAPAPLDPKVYEKEEAITLAWDADAKEQSLVYRGVLTDAEEARLKAAYPSAVFAALLEDVKAQAKTFVAEHLQRSADDPPTGFLTAADDYDVLFAPVQLTAADRDTAATLDDALRIKGENDVARRRRLGERLLPHLRQKLTRQLVVQSMAAFAAADPLLVEALITSASFLGDPEDVLTVVAGAAAPAVDVTFLDNAGNRLGRDEPLDLDRREEPLTSDPRTPDGASVRPANTDRVRFDGYVIVPATGSYRFFVRKGQDTDCELRFAHLPDPLLRGRVGPDPTDLTAKLDLKGGVPYRFTFEVSNLGAGEAELLVKAADLPKGSFRRLEVFAASLIDRAYRAHVRLSKALALAGAFGLTDPEVRYILSNPGDFGVDLRALPTAEVQNGTALFAQVRRLADYARLRKELAGETPDLISVFENAKKTYAVTGDAAAAAARTQAVFDDVTQRLADLTRRDVATVRAAASHIGFAAGSEDVGNDQVVTAAAFRSERGIARLWEVLQIVDQIGISVADIASATSVVSRANPWQTRNDTATRLRNAVKAHYTPEAWRRVAQGIFDTLRQKQRNALVAYILDRMRLDRPEQLFELFLVDAGMEPVVQTSRIQLAIASVQTFIQRCFLNLETAVHPSALDAEQWEWMKRYRVWEANRKIFLYPENWLEAEFRDDKTHLFKDLESALLQGDVSNDLAEDAYFSYLTRFEELARLEIVSSYLEEKPIDPASNVLHVIGRTFAHPHQYFYRRYAHQAWTPWEPVGADIEGDHVTIAIWRERLHLFWVTFLEKGEEPDTTGQTFETYGGTQPPAGKKRYDVQLTWIERAGEEWSEPRTSGFVPAMSSTAFGARATPSLFFVHVTKDYDQNGEEAELHINLDGLEHRFVLTSRNARPRVTSGRHAADIPYGPGLDKEATAYESDIHDPPLRVTFDKTLTSIDGGAPARQQAVEPILEHGRTFTLLLPSNRSEYATPEIESLVRPFFYQDAKNTFFVEPTLTERTVDRYDGFGVDIAPPDWQIEQDDWWRNVPIEPDWPRPLPPWVADPPRVEIDPRAKFAIEQKKDWVTKPETVLKIGEGIVGRKGGIDITIADTLAVRELTLTAATNEDMRGLSELGVTLDEPATRLDIRVRGDVTTTEPVAIGDINVVGGRGLTADALVRITNGRNGIR